MTNLNELLKNARESLGDLGLLSYELNGRHAVITATTDPKITKKTIFGIQWWSLEEMSAGAVKTPYGGTSEMLITASLYTQGGL